MAYVTPVTDWDATDVVAYTDLNRIEGNAAQNHADIGTNKTTTDAHAADSTIHQTNTQCRAASTVPLIVECRTSDPSTPANGTIWLRTDL